MEVKWPPAESRAHIVYRMPLFAGTEKRRESYNTECMSSAEVSEDAAKDEPDRRPEQNVQAIVLSSTQPRQEGTVADLFKMR